MPNIIETFESLKVHAPLVDEYFRGFDDGVDAAIGVITDQSTADLVEVIRCKKCVSCCYENIDGACTYYCGLTGNDIVSTEHYCSYGEKRKSTISHGELVQMQSWREFARRMQDNE